MNRATSVFVSEPGDRSVLQVRDHDLPDPAEGEVQVEVAAAGVNFIDVYKRQGIYPVPTPFVLGEEGAGTVTAVGPGVTDLSVGDRVAWCQATGSESTLVNKPAHLLVPVPDGVDLEIAAAAMLQGLTAHYLVTSTYAVGPGDIALVHAAAGGVGQAPRADGDGPRRDRRRDGRVRREARGRQGARCPAPRQLLDRRRPGGRGPRGCRTRGRRGLRRGREVDLRRVARLAAPARHDGPLRRGERAGAPFDIQRLNSGGSLFLTRPTLAHYVAERAEYEWRAGEVLGAVADGSLKIDVGGRYPLAEAAAAYEALEGRRTTGKPHPGAHRMSRTLFRHERIWTGDAGDPWTDALLVEDGRVVAVGAEAVEAAGAGTDTVDLPGALVMPGLHDAHIHTEWLSRDLSSVDLREARSLEETLEPRARPRRGAARGRVAAQRTLEPQPLGRPRAARPPRARLRLGRPRGSAVERRRPHDLGQLPCAATGRDHP